MGLEKPRPTTTPISDEDLRKSDGGMAKASVAGWTNPQSAKNASVPAIVNDSALGGAAGGAITGSAPALRAGRVQQIDGIADQKGDPWKDRGPVIVP